MTLNHDASAESTEDCDRGLVRAFRIGLVASVLLLASNVFLAVLVFSEGLDYDGMNSKIMAVVSVVGICAHATLAILCRNRSRHPALPWAMIAAGVWNLPYGMISIGAALWLRNKLRAVYKHSD
jgi:hypothetical protein